MLTAVPSRATSAALSLPCIREMGRYDLPGRQPATFSRWKDQDVGPNARRRPRLDGSGLPRMTHVEADKIIARQRRSGPRQRWIIKTRFNGGGTAYWGNQRDGGIGLTPYRTNAIEYESENAARYEGYNQKEARRIGEFEVEQLPPRPDRHSYDHGTGGRA